MTYAEELRDKMNDDNNFNLKSQQGSAFELMGYQKALDDVLKLLADYYGKYRWSLLKARIEGLR